MGRRARWRGADAAKSSKCCMHGWLCQTGQDKFLIKATLHVFLWLDPLLSPAPSPHHSPVFHLCILHLHRWRLKITVVEETPCDVRGIICRSALVTGNVNAARDPVYAHLCKRECWSNQEEFDFDLRWCREIHLFCLFQREFFFFSLSLVVFCIEAVWKGYKTKL